MLRSHFCHDKYCTRVYFKNTLGLEFSFLEWNLRKKNLRFDECGFLRYSKRGSYLAEHQFGKQKVKIGAGYLFKSKNSKDRLLLPYSKTKCIYNLCHKNQLRIYIVASHKLATDSCYGYIFNSTLFALKQNFFFSKLVFLVQSLKRLI